MGLTYNVDSARKDHLHVCPACLGDDKVEYVRCTNQRHVPLSDWETIEEDSLQVFKYCVPHARGHAALVKASPPIEQDVQILLALCEEWGISPVDALVERLLEDRIRFGKVASEMERREALREYAHRIAAGERGFTRALAKKWGLNPSSLKVWAKRQKKNSRPRA